MELIAIDLRFRIDVFIVKSKANCYNMFKWMWIILSSPGGLRIGSCLTSVHLPGCFLYNVGRRNCCSRKSPVYFRKKLQNENVAGTSVGYCIHLSILVRPRVVKYLKQSIVGVFWLEVEMIITTLLSMMSHNNGCKLRTFDTSNFD